MSKKIIDAAEGLAMTSGAHTVTVRSVLKELSITNRVFYNRFHNIDEVLQIIYENTVLKIRESFGQMPDNSSDFFEYVTSIVTNTLLVSYHAKMKFNQYIFENDSLTETNYSWWMSEIKKLIDYAKSQNYIKDVNSEVLAYGLWCFCRGYNADAVGRSLPVEEALENFKYTFSFMLDGLKK